MQSILTKVYISSNLDSDWIDNNFLQGCQNSSKYYILNIFQENQIKIGLNSMFQLGLPKKDQVQFHPNDTTVAYQQHDQNSYCLIILVSGFAVSKQLVVSMENTTHIP